MALDDYDYSFLNETESTEDHQTDPQILYHAVFSTLIFCISLPANSFVLWVLWRERNWRTTADVLLLQLTVSNICFIVPLPFFACNLLHSWIFGLWTCVLTRGLSFLGLISYPLILAVMVLHCYVTVVGASCLNAVVSKISYVVIWLVCAAFSIKHAACSKLIEINYDMEFCFFPPESINMLISDIFINAFFFFIPFIGITFCCIHIWISKKPLSSEGPQPPTKLILRIVVVVFICLTPHYILIFIEALQFLGSFPIVHLFPAIFAHIVISLAYLNCCVSPFFYMFGEQKFRKYLLMPCKRSSQGQEGNSVPFVILEDGPV